MQNCLRWTILLCSCDEIYFYSVFLFKPSSPASQMTFNLCDYIPLAQASFSLLLHFLHFLMVLVSFSTTRIKPIFIHCIFCCLSISPALFHTLSLIALSMVLYILFEYFKHYTTITTTKYSTQKCNFSTGKGVLLHLWLYVSVCVCM